MAMRPLNGNSTRGSGTVAVAVNRLAFGLLVAAGLTLLVAGRIDLPVVERARTATLDGLAPVLDVLSRPVGAANDLIAEIERVSHVYEENKRLREENARLHRWHAVARGLERDNAQYRRLLNVRSRVDVSQITARVIGDSGGPFVRTLLLASGMRDGVQRQQAVVDQMGLVGQVIETGKTAARVLLITDLNSRVPVVLERSRRRAILAGNNTATPMLEFLPVDTNVSPGDRIVTSGQGGVFPPGIDVGIVSEIADGVVRVQPLVDWGTLEHVNVLRYRPPSLTDGRDGP